MRRPGQLVLIVSGCLLALGGGQGLGYQRNSGGGSGNSPAVTIMNGSNIPSASDASNRGVGGSESAFDSASRMAMEDRRYKLMITERQRMMVKEADQIVQTAHDLQASLSGSADPSREESFRRAEAIEKLARNVKDRMKGNR